MSLNTNLKTASNDLINEAVPTNDAFDLEQYASQMQQLDAEAKYTFFAAVLVTLVFWLSIFLTHDSSVTLAHLPLWFVLSCLGGYAFSVVTVIALVKLCLKSMPLKVPCYKRTDTQAPAATAATAAGAADAATAAPAACAAAASDTADASADASASAEQANGKTDKN